MRNLFLMVDQMSITVEAVGEWLMAHMDELFEKYPELKKKLYEKLKKELEEKLSTKDDIKAILEEIKQLRKDFNRQQSQIEGLMTEIKQLREDFNNLSRRLDVKITAIGARWGVMSEEAFGDALRYILEKYFKAKVKKWTYFDKSGYVNGEPAEIDMDILITDREHILIEIKASVDRSDILEIKRIGELYQKITGTKPKLIIVSPFIRERAIRLAAKLGIQTLQKIP